MNTEDYKAERDNALALLAQTNALNAQLAQEHRMAMSALEQAREVVLDAQACLNKMQNRVHELESERDTWRAVAGK